MNREVHVRFWESAGMRCPAPLTYIKAYGSVTEARQGIGGWLGFYNEKRPHQALDYWTPCAVHETTACEHVDNASASLRCAHALPTCSQAHLQEKEVIMH
jgi:hypothetical protein